MLRSLTIAYALACLATHQVSAQCMAAPAATHNVLFIGNSLTYVHDVPAIVESMARSLGDTVSVTMIAFPGYSLEEHIIKKVALAELVSERWWYVVMQQGASIDRESHAQLVRDARRFSDVAKARGAHVMLYGTWGQTTVYPMDDVIKSYASAAKEIGAALAPAGEAWKRSLAANTDIDLYGPDGVHASVAGAYLAAAVITSELLGKDPSAIPVSLQLLNGTSVPLDSVMSRRLLAIAAQVHADNSH